MSSMNRKIGIGVLWNLTSLFMSRGASTVFILFLARLLAPEAFGLIAMATVVFELANSFINSGLGTALIRSKSVSNVDLNTVFYTNLVLSGFAYTIIYVGAPSIANFYSQPELMLLIRVMGLVVFINATKIIQTSIFTRKMDFKSLMKSNTLGTVLSGILSVTAAWKGWGVWSLVVQMLSSALISAVVLWIISKWRPSISFSFDSFRKLFSFGKNLLIEGFLSILFQNSYILVIGRFFSAEITGLYFFAKKISDLISQQLTSAIQQATFPALATIQDDNKALREKYRQIVQLMIFLIAPVMALLSGLAPILIDVAFKESWKASIPYLQLICLVGALYPLHAINVNLLLVKGRSGLLLKIGLIKRAFSLLMLFLAIPYGVSGIIIGQIISSFFALIPNTYFSAQLVSYSIFDQLKDVIKPYISALLAGFTSWLFIQQAASFSIFWLVGGCLVGLFTYLALSYFFRAEGMILLINNLVKKNIFKRLIK